MNIYLDNAATTREDPRVTKAIDGIKRLRYANASSSHAMGEEARARLEEARGIVAASIGASRDEVIFTSSGTEANNLALKGLFFERFPLKNHIITSEIEHESVLNACRWLETQGANVTYLPVNAEGYVSIKSLEAAMTDKTLVVSIIHGNNEIGTIQDLHALGVVCERHRVPFHTDACQSYTKVPIDVRECGMSLMTMNAHKIHGPKGVGALFVKKGVVIQPLLHGGGQEFGLRSSTENVPGIVGFGKAVSSRSTEDIRRMKRLRDGFIKKLLKLDGVRLNGPDGDDRLCNNINVSFLMLEGEAVRDRLSRQGIFVSTGSACSSGSHKTSHVIKAIGSPMEYLHGNVRFSISKYTTPRELDGTYAAVKRLVKELSMQVI